MNKAIQLITLIALLLLSSCSLFQSVSKEEEKKEITLDYQDSLAITAKFIEGKKEALLGNNDKAIDIYSKVLDKNPDHDAALFEMARMYSNLQEYKSALTFAERAKKIEPDNAWYRKMLVDLYQRTGNLEKSREQLVWLIENEDNDLQYYEDWFQVERYMENYDKALEILGDIERIRGRNEKILQQKIRLLQEKDSYEKAAKVAQELLKINKTNPDYYRELIAIYNKLDKPEKALEIIHKFKNSGEDKGWADLMLAKQYRRLGDKKTSFQYLKEAVGNEELTIDAKVEVLMSYYSVSNSTDSLKAQEDTLLNQLMKAHPDSPVTYSLMGDFYLKKNKNAKALESFKKVLEMDSTRYPVWEQIVRLQLQQGKYKKTARYGKKALDFFPNKPNLYFLTANAYSRLSEHQKAIDLYEEGLYFISDDRLKVDFYASLGNQYHEIEDYQASDKAFKKALKIDSGNAYVLNNYAYFLAVRGENLSKAFEMSRKVVKKHPGNATYLDTHGWVLFKQGKYEKALEVLEKAMRNSGGSSEILEHYGDCLFKTDKKNKAVKYWKKAYKNNKSSDELKEKIDKKSLNP